MPLKQLVLCLLIASMFAGGLQAAAQANQPSHKPPVKAPTAKPATIEQQIQDRTKEIADLEQDIATLPVGDILKNKLIRDWVTATCKLERLRLERRFKGQLSKDLFDENEADCKGKKQTEAANKFRWNAPPVVRAGVVGQNQPQTTAELAPANPGAADDAPLKLTAKAEADRKQAEMTGVNRSLIQHPQLKDETPCDKKNKFCVKLDWAQKSPTLMPLRKSGDYTFHAVNLNNILYDYTMTGEAPTPSTDDLSLFADLIKKTKDSLLSAATGGAPPTGALTGALRVVPCPLQADLLAASAPVDALNKALADLQPQPTDKKFASIPLSETKPRVDAIVAAFQALGQPVENVWRDIKDKDLIPNSCTEEWVVAASKLINEQYPKIRSQVDKLDERSHSAHTQDQEFHCEQTIGCSMTIQESYTGTPTTATPNPWKSTLQATLSQLTLSGGFLLTELQARSYSSRSAPDPAAPTTKTVNVLGVDYSSGVRPALTALFNYHLPFPFTDWPKSGFALSAGPVIDIANGKADTSRFGFFGGISAHIWNRFWITPGIHVGEFADTPQGFKGPGDIIPANFGTPTPVKRYTGRFAIAITFQGGNPAALIGEKKADTANPPSPGSAASNKGTKP